MTSTDGTRRDFTLTWTLDAPPAQVFRAWTDPDHLQWYYNDHQPFPTEPIELDLRVGGAWRQRMIIDESTAFVTGGVYREIVRDEKLVFAWGATDGWPELDHDRLDESPLVTVTFSQVGTRTEMTVHVELPASMPRDRVEEWWSMGVREGWRDTVDRLAAELAGGPQQGGAGRAERPVKYCAGWDASTARTRLDRQHGVGRGLHGGAACVQPTERPRQVSLRRNDLPAERTIRRRPHRQLTEEVRVIDVQRVDYIRVPVTDMEEATHFYGEVLGLERNPNSPADDWVEYEVGNVTLAVMTPHTHEYEFTPLPVGTLALGVPDVAEAKAKLEAAGVQVNEMWDSGVCHGAGLRDPAGNPILLHHRYAPYGPR